jgi:hypothetical protein
MLVEGRGGHDEEDESEVDGDAEERRLAPFEDGDRQCGGNRRAGGKARVSEGRRVNEEGGEDPEGGGEDHGMLEVETGSTNKRASTLHPDPDGVGGPALDGGLFHENGGRQQHEDRRKHGEMDAADRSPETQRRRRDADTQQDPGRGRTAEHGRIGGGRVGGGDAHEHDAKHGNSRQEAETVGQQLIPSKTAVLYDVLRRRLR